VAASRKMLAKKELSLTAIPQLHGATFKKRAPKAIKEIKDFATKSMV
jgi:large subunit ribosomal protein L31e